MGGYYTDKYRQPKYLLSGHSLTKILPGKEYTRFIITRIPRDMVQNAKVKIPAVVSALYFVIYCIERNYQ